MHSSSTNCLNAAHTVHKESTTSAASFSITSYNSLQPGRAVEDPGDQATGWRWRDQWRRQAAALADRLRELGHAELAEGAERHAECLRVDNGPDSELFRKSYLRIPPTLAFSMIRAMLAALRNP